MTLIRSLTGKVHAATCAGRGRAYKVLAPEIAASDVADFLAARVKTEDVCGSCLGRSSTRKESIE